MRNPKECAVLRSKKTLIFENMLSPYNANEDDKTSPLQFYHKVFSRFKMTIIDETKHAMSGNINSNAIPGIASRTAYAINRHLDTIYNTAAGNDDASPAYTVKITSGIYKGRTPADVLLKDGQNGKDGLNRQYVWLKSNLSKYPNNKTQMDAIREAATLLMKGELEEKTIQPQQPIVIYDSGFRPLVRKQREDGLSFVYEVHITCNPGNNYPIVVEIQNYYTNVKTLPDGRLNVEGGSKTDIQISQMKMSTDDWSYILYMLQLNMRAFEATHMISFCKAAEADAYQYNKGSNK